MLDIIHSFIIIIIIIFIFIIMIIIMMTIIIIKPEDRVTNNICKQGREQTDAYS